MIAKNNYYSYNYQELPKGCQYCVRGEKLVLFVTGLCPRKCYFCPLSDAKYGNDVTFANERKVTQFEDTIIEAELMQAKGAGITGGDPLVKIDRTIENIKRLKQKYGKEFHIHLYTSLLLVTEQNLELLFEAGLDEIRFHPDLEKKQYWDKIKLAKKYSWDIGIEIPLLNHKEKELLELIEFIKDKVHFIVFNELEIADNKLSKLGEMGYKPKDKLSYAIQDSLELGKRLLKHIEKNNYKIAAHLCTAKLKDAVQLSNRIKREAKFSKKSFDIVDEEGLLLRGAIYLPELTPGMSYRKKLAEIKEKNQDEYNKKLQKMIACITEKLPLKEHEYFVDQQKLRIILSAQQIKKLSKKIKELGYNCAIVREYPTADQLEMEVELL